MADFIQPRSWRPPGRAPCGRCFRRKAGFRAGYGAACGLAGGCGLIEGLAVLGDEIHERIRRMAGDAVCVAGAVSIDRFGDQLPDDVDLGALTAWRKHVRDRVHPAIGGGCLVCDIVLDDEASLIRPSEAQSYMGFSTLSVRLIRCFSGMPSHYTGPVFRAKLPLFRPIALAGFRPCPSLLDWLRLGDTIYFRT